jgi:hypothetical protein
MKAFFLVSAVALWITMIPQGLQGQQLACTATWKQG